MQIFGEQAKDVFDLLIDGEDVTSQADGQASEHAPSSVPGDRGHQRSDAGREGIDSTFEGICAHRGRSPAVKSFAGDVRARRRAADRDDIGRSLNMGYNWLSQAGKRAGGGQELSAHRPRL